MNNGSFFGPVLGTIYCSAGALMGAVASFLISRYYGGEFFSRYLPGHINFCPRCSDLLLTKIVIDCLLIPIVSFSLVSYEAGLTKVSFRAYSLAALAGMLSITFAYNYIGHTSCQQVEEQWWYFGVHGRIVFSPAN